MNKNLTSDEASIDKLIKELRNPDRFDFNDLVPIMHKHPFIGPLLASSSLAANLMEQLKTLHVRLTNCDYQVEDGEIVGVFLPKELLKEFDDIFTGGSNG